MKSFSKNSPGDFSNNMDSSCRSYEPQHRTLDNSIKTSGSNNYETVDYFNSMKPKFKFDPNVIRQQPQYSFRPTEQITSYDSNTADIYSYRELNEIYNENDEIKSINERPSANENSVPTAVNLNSTYIEVKPMNIIEEEKNNIYNASSSVYSVKYLIDINDLKTHLASTNSQATMDTIKTKNSQSNLLQEGQDNESSDEKVVNNFNKHVTKKIHINSNPFFCCKIFGLFFCCFKFFCGLCFKPCCSTAGFLGVLGLLIGLMAGGTLMGLSGVLPIPYEITKNICNTTQDNNYYYYQHNHTFYVEKNSSLEPNIDYKKFCTELYISPNFTAIEEATKNRKIQEKKESLTLELKSNLSKTFEEINNLRNSILHFIPLSYDIIMRPKINTNENSHLLKGKIKSSQIIMNIQMTSKLLCNYSTEIIMIHTKEFSNIDIKLEHNNKPKIKIKRWNHDSLTNILEIELTDKCRLESVYILNIFVSYKNYGKSIKFEEGSKIYFMSNFNEKFESAFPIVVPYYSHAKRQQQIQIYFNNPALFNLSLEKTISSSQLIFNTGRNKRELKDGTEFTTFDPTPFFSAQTLGFVFGDFMCKESYDLEKFSLNFRICSTKATDLYPETFELLSNYVKNLVQFYQNYTKQAYPINKIDLVVVPLKDIDLIEINHVGILYLPESHTDSELYSYDYLTKLKRKLNLVNLLSKQLGKHWYYDSLDFHCLEQKLKESEISKDTLDLMNLCSNSSCSLSETRFYLDQYFELNEKCFLFKGIINWISYSAFKSVEPYLFDLVNLEWSLIKHIDETYFLTNKNLKHIYQYYDHPRLIDGSTFLKIKTELKSLIIAKTLNTILSKERFQSVLNEWTNLIKQLSHGNSLEYQKKINDLRNNEISVLKILEKYCVQFNLIPIEYVSLKEILRSWVTLDSDLVLKVERNYNKKEANVKIKNSNIIKFSYPFNWFKGTLKSVSSFDLNEIDSYNNLNQLSNIVWINDSSILIKNMPGADKWIVGNYMKTFSFFRVNYDAQNWKMLTEQLLFDFKSLNVNERIQIVDDIFYLINNQLLPIAYGLNVLDYIKRENRYLPWKVAIEHIRKIISYIEDDSQIFSKFREFIINLLKPMYERLQWGENMMDSLDEKFIRVLIVDLMCSLDYEDCVQNSVKQLTDMIKINVNNIPLYLRKSVYCTAIRHTGINEWFYLWKMYLIQTQGDNFSLRDSLLYSLSCSSQNWILNLFLRRLVYENSILFEDLPIAVSYISKNPVGKYVTWNHISQNYQNFYNKIGNDPELFVKVLQVSTSEFKFKYEIKQIYDFIEEIGLKNYSIYYEDSNDRLYSNKDNLFSNIESRMSHFTKWKQANSKELDDWLNKKQLSNL